MRRPRIRPTADLGDLIGGVSAAFVLIPQALAYAVLAGMPAERGLYVAALAPIAAAFFASSPYLGTGPTAITSLLTFGALAHLAPPGGEKFVALAALLALMVGVVRVAMGLARLGSVSYLVSRPVLTGFTTGSAIVIIASQIPTILDVPATNTNPFQSALDALRHPQAWRVEALALAVVTAAVMVGGRRLGRFFPGVLVAVVVALAWSVATDYSGGVIGNTTGGFPPFSVDLPWADLPRLVVPALVIAVIGFSEPAAIARHYATLERTRWNPSRELISQGMANLAAGLGGGFPAGGSFTRSALVRDAGAHTRLAGGITGLVVLLLLPVMGVLSRLPTAVLGATIIVAVRGLIDVRPFLEFRRYTRLQFKIAVTTLVLTVALAPHVERALVAGVFLSISAHLWRELRVSVKAWREEDALYLAPKGVLFFASAPLLEERLGDLLAEHPDVRRLVVDLSGLGRIDVDGALGLRGLLEAAAEAGLKGNIRGVPPHARRIVARVLGTPVDDEENKVGDV